MPLKKYVAKMSSIQLKTRLLALLFVLFCQIVLATDQINFKSLSIDDGLSQSTVNCILQDKNGFMWFGTEDALNKYDGHEFTIFRPDPAKDFSISNNFINALAADSSGNIWIATNHGVNKFENSSQKFIHYKVSPEQNTLAHDVVKDILVVDENEIWMATDGGGLSAYSQGANLFKNYTFNEENPYSISSNNIKALAYTKEAGLWAIAVDGKLNHYSKEKDGFEVFKLSQNHESIVFCSIYISPDGMIWLGSLGHGLFRFDYFNNSFIAIDNTINAALKGAEINDIAADFEGNLWLASNGKGVFLYDVKKSTIKSF